MSLVMHESVRASVRACVYNCSVGYDQSYDRIPCGPLPGESDSKSKAASGGHYEAVQQQST